MNRQLIVPGHSLVAEGAAFEDTHGTGIYHHRVQWNSVSGTGVAKCTCGVVSEVLDSARQRKQWHRDHKNQILGDRVVEEIREAGGLDEWRDQQRKATGW